MKKALLISAASTLLGLATAQAQDKATLDILVDKGVITRAEADKIMAAAPKPAPATPGVTPKETPAVEKLTLGGLIQARYSYISEREKAAGAHPNDVSAFAIKRVILAAEANFGDGLSAVIAPEMDAAPVGAGTAQNTYLFYLDRAYMQYTTSAGSAAAGLRKVNFGLDEYGSAATSLTNERSAATIFTATNNFGSRHIGLYWDGKIKDTGFTYGAAVTNSQVNANFPTETINEMAYWANAGYDFICPATGAKAKVGLNLGYIGERGTLPPGPVSGLDGYNLGSAFGYNPYLTLTNGKATFIAEMLGWETEGSTGAADVSILGYNLTGAYKVTDKLEPVVRFSQLRTGELGMSNLAAVTGSTNTRDYTHIVSLYGGVNYYIRGHNFKVQAGYEFSQLTDSLIPGSQLDAHALRIQLQAMF